MKKIIFLALTFLAFNQLNAQFLIEINGKGSYNSTWLLNKNISDKGDDQDYAMAWSSNYGAGFTVYLGHIGVGIEGLFGHHKAAYTGTLLSGNLNYSSEIDLKTSHIPVFLKFRTDKGGFVELGAQMNNISSATYSNSQAILNPSNPSDDSKYYTKTSYSAVFGFGVNIVPIKKFPLGLLIGARLQYGFGDVKGVDALGYDLNNSIYYSNRYPTNIVSGGMYAGLTYTLGKLK